MLVLSREVNQRILIGDQGEIVITIAGIRRCQNGWKVRVGVDAPQGVPVHREEIFDAIKQQEVAENAAQAACETPEPPKPKPKVGMAAATYESELVNKKLRELAQKRRAD